MPDPYFETLTARGDGGTFRPGIATTGPWSERMQHGGPPSALLVRAAERLIEDELGRPELMAVRMAAEFLAPVPVADLDVRASVVRQARSAVLVEAALLVEDRPCLHARIWSVRRADTSAVATAPAPLSVPHGLPDLGARFPYHDTIEWQSLGASMVVPGPGRTWARPRIPLVDAEAMSGLQRVVLVGDSASGISYELDWTQWSFVNIDLDVHLSRPVVGDWILVDARTVLGSAGTALARSTVSDVHGEVGSTAQTLLLAARAG